ncbi:LOW QUALITY PROTEIN: RNA polymerase ECF-subfamily sigma factor, partial [Streptomyces sp. SPB074]
CPTGSCGPGPSMAAGRRSAGSSTGTARPSTTTPSGGRPTGPRPRTSPPRCFSTPGGGARRSCSTASPRCPGCWASPTACCNTRRRLRRAEALLRRLVSHDEQVGDHAERVAGRVDDERRMSEIHRALARLPRHEREVVELCVWSGLDQQAAATVLRVAVSTVKSRLHRARRRLGADLTAGPGDGAPGQRPERASSGSRNPVESKEVAR